MDQAGMKAQLYQLYTLLTVTEPQLALYLNKHDSGNMFFCFRWLLVLFKREFNAVDIMKLWEVLWTDLPCKNFHLLLCTAVLDMEKNLLMENNYGFTEILKVRAKFSFLNTVDLKNNYTLQHINDLSLHIELPRTLCNAEGIYCQLISVMDRLPDNVRTIIGLEPLRRTPIEKAIVEENTTPVHNTHTNGSASKSRKNSADNVKLGDNEVAFERGLALSYM